MKQALAVVLFAGLSQAFFGQLSIIKGCAEGNSDGPCYGSLHLQDYTTNSKYFCGMVESYTGGPLNSCPEEGTCNGLQYVPIFIYTDRVSFYFTLPPSAFKLLTCWVVLFTDAGRSPMATTLSRSTIGTAATIAIILTFWAHWMLTMGGAAVGNHVIFMLELMLGGR